MQQPDGLPILGQVNGHAVDGVASIDRKYALALITTDGAEHVHVIQLGRPTNPDGSVDLGALAKFRPEVHTVQVIAECIAVAQVGGPTLKSVMERMFDGTYVVWRHVTQVRYLGPADELDILPGVEE